MSIDIRDNSQWVPQGTHEKERRVLTVTRKVSVPLPSTNGRDRSDWEWMWGHN